MAWLKIREDIYINMDLVTDVEFYDDGVTLFQAVPGDGEDQVTRAFEGDDARAVRAWLDRHSETPNGPEDGPPV